MDWPCAPELGLAPSVLPAIPEPETAFLRLLKESGDTFWFVPWTGWKVAFGIAKGTRALPGLGADERLQRAVGFDLQRQ